MEQDYNEAAYIKKNFKKIKVPVEATICFSDNGNMTPLYIKWKNGALYKVDRIVDVEHNGINNVSYKIIINNKIINLYYENKVWTVEKKEYIYN